MLIFKKTTLSRIEFLILVQLIKELKRPTPFTNERPAKKGCMRTFPKKNFRNFSRANLKTKFSASDSQSSLNSDEASFI